MSKHAPASAETSSDLAFTTHLKSFTWTLVCLALAIGALFSQSFNPSKVLFSNDAPLGALASQEATAFSNFFGAWQDLNWIGSEQPSALPDITYGFYFLFRALGYAKFFVPFTLCVLGISVWFLMRRLHFHPVPCAVAALAAAFNTDPFSYACWGLAPIALCMAAIFTALGIVASASPRASWIQLCLAGSAVGMGIMEGYDTGAILSLYVAAFLVFQSWTNRRQGERSIAQALAQVTVVAVFAALISAYALSTLIGTQVKGIVGTQQDAKSKEQRWTEATMWSLPKIETLRVIVPGLFGYRMDTPDGGNYWGSVGQTPGVPQSRHSGSGVYAGVLVALVAAWGVARSLAKNGNPFTERERKFIWFWGGAALISLLLAYGRHAPFYQFFYKLPYFSTIRNPIKFMHPFHVALIILFGYGLQGLYRRYLEKDLIKTGSLMGQLKLWWSTASAFEKKWTVGSVAFFGMSLLGWLVYASSHAELERHLKAVGFPAELAAVMARFSVREMGWFVLFLALAVGAVVAVMSGALSGARAKWASIFLGFLLVTDLARANSPWIIYYNYKEKYASNPVLDILRQKPHEQRVASRLSPLNHQGPYLAPTNVEFFPGVCNEWAQHHFQYYRIQSLDIVQMPRMPELDAAFFAAIAPRNSAQLLPIGRLWQLTNTRYLIGMKGYLDVLNQQIDPTNHSFRVHTTFDFASRDKNQNGTGGIEEVTTVLRSEGQFAIFEFGAALPRAKLFSQWQVITNDDQVILQRLVDPAFDPRQTVLLASPLPLPAANVSSNQTAGSVTITHYEPKRVTLKAEAGTPAVLLLNDRFDPNWRVSVDGKPDRLLRCNFIMRGVFLQPGNHAVEFRFDPPHSMLYVSLAAIGAGLALCGILIFSPAKSTDAMKAISEVEQPIPAVKGKRS